MAQGQARHFAPVAAVYVPAGKPAIQMVQHDTVAKIDAGMIRHAVFRLDLHQNGVARLLGGCNRLKTALAKVFGVQV